MPVSWKAGRKKRFFSSHTKSASCGILSYLTGNWLFIHEWCSRLGCSTSLGPECRQTHHHRRQAAQRSSAVTYSHRFSTAGLQLKVTTTQCPRTSSTPAMPIPSVDQFAFFSMSSEFWLSRADCWSSHRRFKFCCAVMSISGASHRWFSGSRRKG